MPANSRFVQMMGGGSLGPARPEPPTWGGGSRASAPNGHLRARIYSGTPRKVVTRSRIVAGEEVDCAESHPVQKRNITRRERKTAARKTVAPRSKGTGRSQNVRRAVQLRRAKMLRSAKNVPHRISAPLRKKRHHVERIAPRRRLHAE